MKPAYNSLTSKKGNHGGGIVKMHVAPKDWLSEEIVIDFTTNKIIQPVKLLPGKEWIPLGFTKPSFEFNDDPKSNKSGSYYEVTCAGIMNNYDNVLQQTIETLRYYELLTIVTDRFQRQRFIGNMEQGMVIAGKHVIKNNFGEESLSIKFFMEAEKSPPYIDAESFIKLPEQDDILFSEDNSYLVFDSDTDYILSGDGEFLMLGG